MSASVEELVHKQKEMEARIKILEEKNLVRETQFSMFQKAGKAWKFIGWMLIIFLLFFDKNVMPLIKTKLGLQV